MPTLLVLSLLLAEPPTADSYARLARAHALHGQLVEARQAILEAIRRKPGNPTYQSELRHMQDAARQP